MRDISRAIDRMRATQAGQNDASRSSPNDRLGEVLTILRAIDLERLQDPNALASAGLDERTRSDKTQLNDILRLCSEIRQRQDVLASRLPVISVPGNYMGQEGQQQNLLRSLERLMGDLVKAESRSFAEWTSHALQHLLNELSGLRQQLIETSSIVSAMSRQRQTPPGNFSSLPRSSSGPSNNPLPSREAESGRRNATSVTPPHRTYAEELTVRPEAARQASERYDDEQQTSSVTAEDLLASFNLVLEGAVPLSEFKTNHAAVWVTRTAGRLVAEDKEPSATTADGFLLVGADRPSRHGRPPAGVARSWLEFFQFADRPQ